jgi:hypothetical protein
MDVVMEEKITTNPSENHDSLQIEANIIFKKKMK